VNVTGRVAYILISLNSVGNYMMLAYCPLGTLVRRMEDSQLCLKVGLPLKSIKRT